MSAPAQSTTDLPTNSLQIEENTASMADFYFEGDARRFMDNTYHQTSTFIYPSPGGDTFERNSNACDMDPNSRHHKIHYYIIDAFRSNLASYAKEIGTCETQERLSAACRAMAGFHNNRHEHTKIFVSPPDPRYGGSVVATKVTVADSLPELLTHVPFYRVDRYQGQSKPDSEK